jgi:hypothetical protein
VIATQHGVRVRIEFVQLMPSMKDAYQAVLDIDEENPILVAGSGIILLIRNDGCTDWYFYVDLRDPNAEDKGRILHMMDKSGTRTDQRINDLLLNPHFGGCFSGDATRIANGLRQLIEG